MPASPDSPDSNAMPSGNAAVPKGGYVPMKAKPGAERYSPSAELGGHHLPRKVDLRRFMTPVEDQGETSSCVANAVAGAYEYAVKRATRRNYDVSRLYVYYNARWRAKEQDQDAGSVIQYAMEGLQHFGACPEKTWPFKKALLLKKPNRPSYQQGATARVHQMKQVPMQLPAWKQALAEGLPIVFGCVLFDSFDDCTERGGVVPMPSPEDLTRAEHGGHSMCCVGYSDVEKVFIIRNSWGDDWADQGYCYMPYDYLMNPKFNDGDCWVFTPPIPYQPQETTPSPDHSPPRFLPATGGSDTPRHGVSTDHPLPLPREMWSDDDRPVVNGGRGVDFPIQTYRPEDYEHVRVNYFAEYVQTWTSVVATAYAAYTALVSEHHFDQLEQYSVAEMVQEYAQEENIPVSEANESLAQESTSETNTALSGETSEAGDGDAASNGDGDSEDFDDDDGDDRDDESDGGEDADVQDEDLADEDSEDDGDEEDGSDGDENDLDDADDDEGDDDDAEDSSEEDDDDDADDEEYDDDGEDGADAEDDDESEAEDESDAEDDDESGAEDESDADDDDSEQDDPDDSDADQEDG